MEFWWIPSQVFDECLPEKSLARIIKVYFMEKDESHSIYQRFLITKTAKLTSQRMQPTLPFRFSALHLPRFMSGIFHFMFAW